ncbi:MAG TPA: hypothetical protein VIO34_03725 [Candidatus Dormibacteraeota bacterium]
MRKGFSRSSTTSRRRGRTIDELVRIIALFTHRVRVSTTAEVDSELETWLRAAYLAAG